MLLMDRFILISQLITAYKDTMSCYNMQCGAVADPPAVGLYWSL